ncbi:peptidoglycan-binding domain-containing protein [Streptomyces sp. DSM 3412]|uniref:Peptidoglycan-binding domain-containing protein n=1 Tax=Streptomyces gottesmaniae TaxID=3075518 RepID=A0ABU2YSX4_9ACTN|nr:peptidoglycan-binding domain-containing protein [Streptomyces sp. DSM 3412]MDT0567081.1 peptidoglycan-binding domain-containing protein [Streptomyces sp. DSM 3412]
MQQVSTTLRMRSGVLGALALLFAAGLTASPMMTAPAHAAYGPCNTTVKRTDGLGSGGNPGNHYKIPARTGNGLSCYMKYQTGSPNAVRELQWAIVFCYSGTYAANRINATGGIDGIYGTGTVDAVRWLQANRLGVSADGEYGPATREQMQWVLYTEGGNSIGCLNPPF